MGTGTAGSLHLDPHVGSRHWELREDGMGFQEQWSDYTQPKALYRYEASAWDNSHTEENSQLTE